MALLEEGERRIGENVRAARHYRGMSLETLAGLVGRSKGWLSKIENGSARLERRTDIAAIADALEVSASDIIGEAAPIIRSGRSHDYDAIPLRDILLETTLDDPSDIRPRPLREVTADAANVRPAWDAVDYAGLCHLLPRVIGDLQVIAATAATGEREDALRNLIDVCIVATWILRHIGRIDSAWIAAERAQAAAERLGDPVAVASAAFARAHARRAADRPRGLMTAGQAADTLRPHLDSGTYACQVYGMLRLSAALACTLAGDHRAAADHAAEAAEVAERVGERPHAWESFGPANTGVWRVMLAVEAGDPDEALRVSASVNRVALANGDRRAAMAGDVARAHAMVGNDRAAVSALREAERLSPAKVHHDLLLRDLVAHLLDRARREAGGRELRGLAWRMNLI